MNADLKNDNGKCDEVSRFIIKLGKMVHGYGPNAIRLESYLSRVTTALGYPRGS